MRAHRPVIIFLGVDALLCFSCAVEFSPRPERKQVHEIGPCYGSMAPNGRLNCWQNTNIFFISQFVFIKFTDIIKVK